MGCQIRGRSDWAEGNHPPQGEMTDMGAVIRITIHHSSNDIGSNPSDQQVKNEISRIWDMHAHGKIYSEVSRQIRMQENISTVDYSAMTEKGSVRAPLYLMKSVLSLHAKYDDIGYHYLIDPRGIIWEGRSIGKQGAHAYDSTTNINWNIGNIGIVLLGDFTQRHPTEKQLTSMKDFTRSLMEKYDVPIRNLFGHSDLDHGTICPGPNLLRRVHEMKYMDSPLSPSQKFDDGVPKPKDYTSIA